MYVVTKSSLFAEDYQQAEEVTTVVGVFTSFKKAEKAVFANWDGSEDQPLYRIGKGEAYGLYTYDIEDGDPSDNFCYEITKVKVDKMSD